MQLGLLYIGGKQYDFFQVFYRKDNVVSQLFSNSIYLISS